MPNDLPVPFEYPPLSGKWWRPTTAPLAKGQILRDPENGDVYSEDRVWNLCPVGMVSALRDRHGWQLCEPCDPPYTAEEALRELYERVTEDESGHGFTGWGRGLMALYMAETVLGQPRREHPFGGDR